MNNLLRIGAVGLDVRRWPGDGAPILLLHEALGAATTWRDYPDKLAAATGHPVIAWSRAGVAFSDPLPGRPGHDYLHREAEAVLRLMDLLKLERAHLHGHSDGAAIALIVAASAPERVLSLVLEAPHVTVEGQTTAAIVAVRDLWPDGVLRGKLARHHKDPDRVFANWAETWLDPGFRSWSIEDLLPRITAPTLLLQGVDDPYFSLGQLDRIERAVPGAQRLELADCGHAPYREQRETVLAATTAFTQRVDVL